MSADVVKRSISEEDDSLNDVKHKGVKRSAEANDASPLGRRSESGEGPVRRKPRISEEFGTPEDPAISDKHEDSREVFSKRKQGFSSREPRDESPAEDTPNRRRRRPTGWDEVGPVPTTPTNGTPHKATPDPAQLADCQLQAANIAAQMQSKASMSQMCRIYVGSLDYSLTESDIRQVLESFGKVVNIDMPKEGNRSKGFCFVEYATPEAADMVLTTLNGFELKGRPIKVGRPTAMGGVPKEAMVPAPMGAKPSVDPAAAGVMAAASLLANRSTPAAMASPGAVSPAGQNAVSLPPTLGNQAIYDPQALQSGMNRIYVGSVPYGFSAEEVKQIFQVFGTIMSCQLIPSNERPGTHRGYGFIEYQTVAQAKLAIETMNGFQVAGKQLKVNHATALRNTPNGLPTTPTGLPTPSVISSVPAPPISIPDAQGQMQSSSVGFSMPVVSPGKLIMLTNMVTPDKLDDDLKDELQGECSKYGEIRNVNVKIVGNDVRTFVEFAKQEDAGRAIPHLHGRWFDGHQIVCRFYDEGKFQAGEFTL